MLVFMKNHYKWFFWYVSAGDPAISGAQLLPLGYQRAYVPIIGFVGGGRIGFLLQQWINLLKIKRGGHSVSCYSHRSHHARHHEFRNQCPSSISDLVAFFFGSEMVKYCYELFSGFRDFSGLIRNQNVLCS
jgi:hypothetical protein